jgi:cytochrome c553
MPLSSRMVLNALVVIAGLGLGAQARSAGEPGAGEPGAGDPARGKDLSYTCLGCHGIQDYKNVYPTYSVPELAGQHPGYILAALQEYKSGQRAHGTMHQQAASLSDQDMADIASYFGTPTLSTSAAPVGNAPVKATLCASCHGKNGVGITTDYPNLAGQHADYIARALVEYAHGDRKNPIMPNFVVGLSDSDIEEISNYYARQTPGLQTAVRRQSFLSAK